MITHEQAVEHTRTLPQLFPIHIDIGTERLVIHGEIALDSHQLAKCHIQLLLLRQLYGLLLATIPTLPYLHQVHAFLQATTPWRITHSLLIDIKRHGRGGTSYRDACHR